MRSPWTNPTIIRRPTIAVLSAVALLVACDQPAGPVARASRPGGILADAQSGTVSAHGNGQVALTEECQVVAGVCEGGGQGAEFRFDFSGPNTGPPAVTVTGTFSVKFRETGDVVSYQGTATIFPNFHQLQFTRATCSVTTAAGMTFSIVPCSLFAEDDANSDVFHFAAGVFPVVATANDPVVSGGIHID